MTESTSTLSAAPLSSHLPTNTIKEKTNHLLPITLKRYTSIQLLPLALDSSLTTDLLTIHLIKQIRDLKTDKYLNLAFIFVYICNGAYLMTRTGDIGNLTVVATAIFILIVVAIVWIWDARFEEGD